MYLAEYVKVGDGISMQRKTKTELIEHNYEVNQFERIKAVAGQCWHYEMSWYDISYLAVMLSIYCC